MLCLAFLGSLEKWVEIDGAVTEGGSHLIVLMPCLQSDIHQISFIGFSPISHEWTATYVEYVEINIRMQCL